MKEWVGHAAVGMYGSEVPTLLLRTPSDMVMPVPKTVRSTKERERKGALAHYAV